MHNNIVLVLNQLMLHNEDTKQKPWLDKAASHHSSAVFGHTRGKVEGLTVHHLTALCASKQRARLDGGYRGRDSSVCVCVLCIHKVRNALI